MYAFPLFPMQSGLNPNGSRAPISFLGDMITREYAPFSLSIALDTASSTLVVSTLALATW